MKFSAASSTSIWVTTGNFSANSMRALCGIGSRMCFVRCAMGGRGAWLVHACSLASLPSCPLPLLHLPSRPFHTFSTIVISVVCCCWQCVCLIYCRGGIGDSKNVADCCLVWSVCPCCCLCLSSSASVMNCVCVHFMSLC